jgi:hypothetical protein
MKTDAMQKGVMIGRDISKQDEALDAQANIFLAEIWNIIFSYLTDPDRIRLGSTSRFLYQIFHNHLIWKEILGKTYIGSLSSAYAFLVAKISIIKSTIDVTPTNMAIVAIKDFAQTDPAIAIASIYYNPSCRLLLGQCADTRGPQAYCYIGVIANTLQEDIDIQAMFLQRLLIKAIEYKNHDLLEYLNRVLQIQSIKDAMHQEMATALKHFDGDTFDFLKWGEVYAAPDALNKALSDCLKCLDPKNPLLQQYMNFIKTMKKYGASAKKEEIANACSKFPKDRRSILDPLGSLTLYIETEEEDTSNLDQVSHLSLR